MLERGFEPSEQFLTEASKIISTTRPRVDNAYYNILPSCPVSISSLNVILGAYAELGSVDEAFGLFEEFTLLHNLQPNTFSHWALLRALYVEADRTATKMINTVDVGVEEEKYNNIGLSEMVDAVESSMVELELKRSPTYLHWHVAALVKCGERTGDAVKFLQEAVERGDKPKKQTFINLRKYCCAQHFKLEEKREGEERQDEKEEGVYENKEGGNKKKCEQVVKGEQASLLVIEIDEIFTKAGFKQSHKFQKAYKRTTSQDNKYSNKYAI
uniref:Pentatricopeptide repeat-containing protein n=1 Tax=Corethron hystrix TaxID=216773 RepID=A0A7S1BIG7_9STRA|mmetsp:Transcript_27594/g.63252  ORF Transcript_27594/g.63252 Transcript_27594/m.63252 type:complete len:271 (+) Transcript_27594:1441-2253(+)